MEQAIVDAIVQFAIIAIGAFVTAIANRFADAYKAKMTILRASEKNQMLVETIDGFVKAVEQRLSGDSNTVKFDKANEYVRQFLTQKGITLEDYQITALIESAVYSMKQGISQLSDECNVQP